MLIIIIVTIHELRLSTTDDSLSHSLLCFSGEWQTRFDPQVTSKGAFYLDNQNSVLVDMMKSAQYPLRLLDDPELEAQVTPVLFCRNPLLDSSPRCLICFGEHASLVRWYHGVLSVSYKVTRCPSYFQLSDQEF